MVVIFYFTADERGLTQMIFLIFICVHLWLTIIRVHRNSAIDPGNIHTVSSVAQSL